MAHDDVGFIDYAIESRTRNFVVGKGGGGGGDLGVVLVGTYVLQ